MCIIINTLATFPPMSEIRKKLMAYRVLIVVICVFAGCTLQRMNGWPDDPDIHKIVLRPIVDAFYTSDEEGATMDDEAREGHEDSDELELQIGNEDKLDESVQDSDSARAGAALLDESSDSVDRVSVVEVTTGDEEESDNGATPKDGATTEEEKLTWSEEVDREQSSISSEMKTTDTIVPDLLSDKQIVERMATDPSEDVVVIQPPLPIGPPPAPLTQLIPPLQPAPMDHDGATGTEANDAAEQSAESADMGAAYHNIDDCLQIKAYNEVLYKINNVYGGQLNLTGFGGLKNRGDSRIYDTVIVNDMENMNNISSSFDLRRFECVVCKSNHTMRDMYGRSVIMLGDQTIPPSLPALDPGNCIGIVRIEDSNPLELANFFIDNLADKISRGSVILISAGTYLARTGMAAYSADLAAARAMIYNSVENGCNVTAGPFLPMKGTKDFGWISAISDLVAWIEQGAGQGDRHSYMLRSHRAMVKILRKRKVGGAWLGMPARAILPCSLTN